MAKKKQRWVSQEELDSMNTPKAQQGGNMHFGYGYNNPGQYQIGQSQTGTNDTLQPTNNGNENVEVEKSEVIAAPVNGGKTATYTAGGKRHSEGGTPLQLPSGAFIYSDTSSMKISDPEILKLFGVSKPMTPADIASKFKVNKLQQIVSDPDTDDIQKKSAKLEIGNREDQLAKLALIQESMKGLKDGIPAIAKPYLEKLGVDQSQVIGNQQDTEQMNPTSKQISKFGSQVMAKVKEYQKGGQTQQLESTVAQMLQNQTDPQQIVQQLVQHGIKQNKAIKVVQGVLKQMQGSQQPQQDPNQQPQQRFGGTYIGGTGDGPFGMQVAQNEKGEYITQYKKFGGTYTGGTGDGPFGMQVSMNAKGEWISQYPKAQVGMEVDQDKKGEFITPSYAQSGYSMPPSTTNVDMPIPQRPLSQTEYIQQTAANQPPDLIQQTIDPHGQLTKEDAKTAVELAAMVPAGPEAGAFEGTELGTETAIKYGPKIFNAVKAIIKNPTYNKLLTTAPRLLMEQLAITTGEQLVQGKNPFQSVKDAPWSTIGKVAAETAGAGALGYGAYKYGLPLAKLAWKYPDIPVTGARLAYDYYNRPNDASKKFDLAPYIGTASPDTLNIPSAPPAYSTTVNQTDNSNKKIIQKKQSDWEKALDKYKMGGQPKYQPGGENNITSDYPNLSVYTNPRDPEHSANYSKDQLVNAAKQLGLSSDATNKDLQKAMISKGSPYRDQVMSLHKQFGPNATGDPVDGYLGARYNAIFNPPQSNNTNWSVPGSNKYQLNPTVNSPETAGIIPQVNIPQGNKPYSAPGTFWTQDINNSAEALRERLGLSAPRHWQAPLAPNERVQPTFQDPTRELASVAEMANAGLEGNNIFGNPSQGTEYTGKAAENVANILGRYNDTNTSISNNVKEFNAQNQNKYNADTQGIKQGFYNDVEGDRLKFLAQQRQADRNIVDTTNTALTNRGITQTENTRYPQWQVDPRTGYSTFDPNRMPELGSQSIYGQFNPEQEYKKEFAFLKSQHPNLSEETLMKQASENVRSKTWERQNATYPNNGGYPGRPTGKNGGQFYNPNQGY